MTQRQLLISVLTTTLAACGIAAATFASGSAYAQEASPALVTEIGRYSGPGAEIAAYDPNSQILYVAGGGVVQVLDLADPAAPALFETLALPATSVAVRKQDGLVAIAVPSASGKTRGRVVLIDPAAPDVRRSVLVGYLPDMLTFTPDGTKLLVANEGERTDTRDPEGSVSVIDLSEGPARARHTALKFGAFDDRRAELVAAGVRVFPDAASVARDLEPEYIAVAPDSSTAWVTLQENNALAVVDLVALEISTILPLGRKDHSMPGNGLDASDEDGGIHIANWPVFGLYLPDGIAALADGEALYLVTANEGDDRGENVGVGEVTLDPRAFPDAAALQAEEALGRLNISPYDGDTDGDTDGDYDYDELVAYGARSFSVWDATNGNLVFDSGDQFERRTAELTPELFNANDGDPGEFDKRSDNKGPEPEGVAVGVVAGTPYAFVGLERAGGGVMVYDMSDPHAPQFVEYVRSAEDIAPEGLLFVPATESPTGSALLIVTNEVSNTVTVYEVGAGS